MATQHKKFIEIYADTRGYGTCSGKDCGERILWATVVASGRKMCFQPDTFAAYTKHDAAHRLIEALPFEDNHWAHCRNARAFEKKPNAGEMTRQHSCAVRSCKVTIPLAQLMCLKHWRMVPPDLQREVWKWYRLRGRSVADAERHLTACDNARTAVEIKIGGLFTEG